MNQNTVTEQQVDEILENAVISWDTKFDKCTVMYCQLENGFIIVESSACVDPENYSSKMGYKICLERVRNRVWELEGYALQKSIN